MVGTAALGTAGTEPPAPANLCQAGMQVSVAKLGIFYFFFKRSRKERILFFNG